VVRPLFTQRRRSALGSFPPRSTDLGSRRRSFRNISRNVLIRRRTFFRGLTPSGRVEWRSRALSRPRRLRPADAEQPNRSPHRRNGKWKIASRDPRQKSAPQETRARKAVKIRTITQADIAEQLKIDEKTLRNPRTQPPLPDCKRNRRLLPLRRENAVIARIGPTPIDPGPVIYRDKYGRFACFDADPLANYPYNGQEQPL
jgi:hypothetical protein